MTPLLFLFWVLSHPMGIAGAYSWKNDFQKILDQHFKHFAGIYLYTCEDEPFGMLFKQISAMTIKYQLLNEQENVTNIRPNRQNPSNIGVLLDVDCPGSYSVLEKSSEAEMFSWEIKWLLIGQPDFDRLASLKLSLDSRVILDPVSPEDSRGIASGGEDKPNTVGDLEPAGLYYLYKVHYSAPLMASEWYPTAPNTSRYNLGGFKMDVCFVLLKPFGVNESFDNFMDVTWRPEEELTSRVTFPLYKILGKDTNMTYNLLPFEGWGYDQGGGKWSGFIGALQRRECEFSLQTIKGRVDWTEALDLVGAVMQSKSVFFFLQPRVLGSHWALVTPMSATIWVLVIIHLVLYIVAFTIISKYDPSPDLEDVGALIILTVGNLAQQGYSDTTKLFTSRVMCFSLLVFTFFVFVYYSGAILYGLLCPSPNSITTIEDLILDSGFKFVINDQPYYHDFEGLENPFGNDKLTAELVKKIEKQDIVSFASLDDGVKAVQKGDTAFYSDHRNVFRSMRSFLSDVEICSGYFIRKVSPYVLTLNSRNKSPYNKMISFKFSRMREAGLIQREMIVWFDARPECNWTQDAVSIGLKASSVAFLVMLAGATMSLGVFFRELRRASRAARRVNKRRTNPIPKNRVSHRAVPVITR